MAKEEMIQLNGVVKEALPNAMFYVGLENNDTVVLCYVGGKVKKNKIDITIGDTVDIEVSPYNVKRGRIVYRRR